MQETAWLYSLFLMAVIGVGFAYVALRSGKRRPDYATLATRAYRWRTGLFWLLVLTFFPVMIYNLFDLPYGSAESRAQAPARTITAIGHMWYWELDEDEVTQGELVEIRVSSADVNHGFGIYDPSMRLVAQTQAMPGYVNTVRHRFDQAGDHRVLCLEYCGLVHHNMMAEIHVKPQTVSN